MSNFKPGQKIRIIGDTFQQDPHGLEIGSVHTIDSINEATKFEEMPPHIQLALLFQGIEKFDLPERIHIKTGSGQM